MAAASAAAAASSACRFASSTASSAVFRPSLHLPSSSKLSFSHVVSESFLLSSPSLLRARGSAKTSMAVTTTQTKRGVDVQFESKVFKKEKITLAGRDEVKKKRFLFKKSFFCSFVSFLSYYFLPQSSAIPLFGR